MGRQILKFQYPNMTGPDVIYLQKFLIDGGYLQEATGKYDAATVEAVRKFQENNGLDIDGVIGNRETWPLIEAGWEEETAPAAAPPATEYDFSTKEGTIAAIRAESVKQGLTLLTQQAYVIATVRWETAGTFKPVREAYWKSESWRKANLRYYPYYGRGYVQVTWKTNYQKYAEVLGIDLVNNPDLALDSYNSLLILVHGFRTGAFTGKKITNYINENKIDYVNARRCINALDKAHEIAAIAREYERSIDGA